MLQRIDKTIRIATKLIGYSLTLVFIVIFMSVLYMAIVYPQKIANKTKLGMSRQQVEEAYATNSYRYEAERPVCMIGCHYNRLTNGQSVSESDIKKYMVVWTGIDGVFVIGFDKNDKVIFADSGET